MKEKIESEYHFNCSSSLLFRLISTDVGLAGWFADKVVIEPDDIYLFFWGKQENPARMVSKADNESIRFQWEEDWETDAYFEFRITSSEISDDLSLFVTDFCDPDEKEDTLLYWQNNIRKLKLISGSD